MCKPNEGRAVPIPLLSLDSHTRESTKRTSCGCSSSSFFHLLLLLLLLPLVRPLDQVNPFDKRRGTMGGSHGGVGRQPWDAAEG
jgi:hypothetical protein